MQGFSLDFNFVQDAVKKVPQPKDVFQAVHNHFLQLADSVAWPQNSIDTPKDQNTDFLGSSLAAFLGRDPQADRLLSLRAMTQLYDHHAGEIGENF